MTLFHDWQNYWFITLSIKCICSRLSFAWFVEDIMFSYLCWFPGWFLGGHWPHNRKYVQVRCRDSYSLYSRFLSEHLLIVWSGNCGNARAVFFIFKGLLTWLYSKWILIQKRKTEMWAVPVSVFNTVVLRVVLNQDKCFISIRQSAAASALDFSLLGRQRRWTYYQHASSRWLLFVFCLLTPVAPWLNDVFGRRFNFNFMSSWGPLWHSNLQRWGHLGRARAVSII